MFATTTAANLPTATTTDTDVPTTDTDPQNDVVVSPPKKKRKLHSFRTHTFTSQGTRFEFELPTSHVIVPKNYIQSLKKYWDGMDTLNEKTKKLRWTKNASEITNKCISFGLASAPGMAVNALAYVLPVMTAGFLNNYELYSCIAKKENFTSCFPSAATLRNTITDQAAEDLVLLSHELEDKYVFIGCDKGELLVLMFW